MTLSQRKGLGSLFSLVFEFDHEGRTIVGSIRNDKYFNQAVIGKKYVVRYVPEKITEKTFTDYAKIYIDIPVLQEHIDGQDIQDYAARDSTIKE